MVRKYVQVTDKQRHDLVHLINDRKFSIAKASKQTGIPYDNAKAVNRTYLKEGRVRKIDYQERYQNSKERKRLANSGMLKQTEQLQAYQRDSWPW